MKLKIGLTGGIGSGKSLCSRVFSVLGVPVFNSDEVAREIMRTDRVVHEALRERFGLLVFTPEGIPDRKKIAGLVFENEGALQDLNSIIHPAVFEAYHTWLNDLPAAVTYSIKETAILFESGSDRDTDCTIVVVSPPELRMARTMARDASSRQQVELRMARQMTDEEKIKRADFIIQNDERASILRQITYLHNRFLLMAL